jgi:hypothetical protein
VTLLVTHAVKQVGTYVAATLALRDAVASYSARAEASGIPSTARKQ